MTKLTVLSSDEALKVVQLIAPLIDKNVRLYSEARKSGFRRLKWAYIPPTWMKDIFGALDKAGISYEFDKHPDSHHYFVAVRVPTDFKVRNQKMPVHDAVPKLLIEAGDSAYFRPKDRGLLWSPRNRPWLVVHISGTQAWIQHGESDYVVSLSDLEPVPPGDL